jgi:hypothetical protein
MNKLSINVIALAVCLAFSGGVLAERMSTSDYKAGKDKIAAEYKAATAGCGSLAGNQKDICVAEATGNEKIATAELDARNTHSLKTQYQVRVAKAEAGYAVAKERCDDMSGNAKDVCVKEAKAAETAAMADAKAQMKASEASKTANEKSAAAFGTADAQTATARKDAAADKLEAQYAVAKEKCDQYAGAAKDVCLDRAKVQFGKS